MGRLELPACLCLPNFYPHAMPTQKIFITAIDLNFINILPTI
jgi:hypothetical protein